MFDVGPPPKLWLPTKPSIIRAAEPIKKSPSLANFTYVNAWLLAAAGGAAPAFAAVGTIASAGAASVNVAHYASVAANDIAFIWMGSDAAISDVSGWTGLSGISQGVGLYARLFWKRMSGGESGNVSVSASGANIMRGFMVGFSGAITSGTPYEGANSATGTSDPDASATIVTTAANRLGLRFGHNWTGGVSSPPSGWTERADGGGGYSVTCDEKIIASASTEPSSGRTYGGGSAWAIQTLALLPP